MIHAKYLELKNKLDIILAKFFLRAEKITFELFLIEVKNMKRRI